MPDHECLSGNHQVGVIANDVIRMNDWSSIASAEIQGMAEPESGSREF